MARADLLVDLVRAGARGDQNLFRKALSGMVAEERAKQHHLLADRLAAHLAQDPRSSMSPNYKGSGRHQNLFLASVPERRLDDLFIPDNVRVSCQELLEEHNRAELLRAHSIEPRNRVLLAGPPGNGKTSLAEAIACELAVPLFSVRYESIIGSYLGETAVKLAKLFEEVRGQRCVLFFDEFDVVGKERGDAHETGEIKRVVSSLLLQIDALPSHVVVVTATNHAELLDRAVWRRFQLRLKLPAPNQKNAEAYFKMFQSVLREDLGVSPLALAKKLKGLSFSEFEEFCSDIQRKRVLEIPNANLPKIVSNCLLQWENRFQVPRPPK